MTSKLLIIIASLLIIILAYGSTSWYILRKPTLLSYPMTCSNIFNPFLLPKKFPFTLQAKLFGTRCQKPTQQPPIPTPPLSQAYSLCQTDVCKKILKNKESARVIVGVKLPRPTPANWLQDPKLEQQLRQDVSQAISQVLQQLKPEIQKSAIPFEFIPYFALTVDQQTLDFLSTSPQVTSIEDDKLAAPN